MSNVWAHCAGCDRWFYPGATDGLGAGEGARSARGTDRSPGTDADLDGRGREAATHCPVCSRPADRIEDRSNVEPDGDRPAQEASSAAV